MHNARTHSRRRPLVAAAAALVTAGAVVAYAAADSPTERNTRLNGTFTTTLRAINNQIGTYGIEQAIVKGSGTVERFGRATVTTGITQDRTVTPCGAGSSVDQSTSRIVTVRGKLILRLSGTRCFGPDGTEVVRGTYVVDGKASSGVFAGATGDGESKAVIGTPSTVTFTGKLKVAS